MAVEPLPRDISGRIAREKLRVAWIVEETINFYRKHFISIFTLFLLANFATWTVQYYFGDRATDLFEKNNLSISEMLETPEESASKVLPLLVDFFLLLAALVVILYLVSLIFHSMAIRYVYDYLLGGHPSWPGSLTRILPALPQLIGATIVAGVIITLGFVALVIPGLILSVMFILVPHAVILEGHGPIGAMSRSNRLTAGNKFTIFLFLLFWMVVLLLFYMVLSLAGASPWMEAVQFAAASLFAPIIPISTTLIYHRMASDITGSTAV